MCPFEDLYSHCGGCVRLRTYVFSLWWVCPFEDLCNLIVVGVSDVVGVSV